MAASDTVAASDTAAVSDTVDAADLSDAASSPDVVECDPSSCDDDDACTTDSCEAGKCVSVATVCVSHACGSSTCNSKTGSCEVAAFADGTPCGGARVCSGGECRLPFATQIRAGRQTSCALRPTGAVWCWGANSSGELGRGDLKYHPPGPAIGVTAAVDLTVGWQHVCASLKTGAVRCWGRGSRGQLGNGAKPATQPTSVTATDVTTADEVVAGQFHTCARTGGGLRCWGDNASRQVRAAPSASGVQLKVSTQRDIAGARQYAAGGYSSCAVTADRQVRCWGRNSDGQSGRGYSSAYSHGYHTAIGLTDIAQVAVGGFHVCARSVSGKVWCWGRGSSGQLGIGSTTKKTLPTAVVGLTDVVSLSASNLHTCALRQDGAVWCWGSNKYGQLGTGTTSTATKPVKTATSWLGAEVSAGAFHTCMRRRDGALACWGLSSSWDELLVGKKGNYLKPMLASGTVPPAAKTCKSAADCGAANGCFGWLCHTGRCATTLTKEGAVCDDNDACSSDDRCALGRCGGKPKCDDNNPCTVDRCDRTTGKCAVGLTIALCNDGDACSWIDRCKAGKCAGAVQTCDDGNACTKDTCAAKTGACSHSPLIDQAACSDGSVCTAQEACKSGVCAALAAPKTCADDGNPCTTNSCDPSAGCATTEVADGSPCGPQLLCAKGQCVVPFASDVRAGHNFTCALRPSGQVTCWGRNQFGQRGDGVLTGDMDAPTAVKGVTNVAELRAGHSHACAVRTDGKVYCWGRNDWGTIGDGTKAKTGTHTPALVATTVLFRSVRPAYAHTCGLDFAGNTYCWGSTSGRRHHNASDNTTVTKPALVAGLPQLYGLGAQVNGHCGLNNGGGIWCWGANTHGQLGQGTVSNAAGGSPIVGLKAQAVAGGYQHGCALTAGGTVYCWGDNTHGQLGDGSTNAATAPVKVALLDDAVSISSSYQHTCVVRSGGSVWCWGRNNRRQCGASVATPVTVPLRVSGVSARRVTAGLNHTCALLKDGSIKCWGNNSYNELGIGKQSWSYSGTPKALTKSAPAKWPCSQNADCGSSGACFDAACVAGACVQVNKKAATACDDANPCTKNDGCSGGRCRGALACDDGNACTQDVCATGSCKFVAAKALLCDDGDACTSGDACDGKAACVAGPKACAATDVVTGNIVTGKVTWDWVPALNKADGGPRLGYDKLQPRPARKVRVLAISAGKAIASTVTDHAGAYTLAVPKGAKLKVRVLAELRGEGQAKTANSGEVCDGAHYAVRVVDNTNGKSLYAIEGPEITAPKKGHNLHAPLAHDGKSYTKRQAAPFAILDACLRSVETVCQGDPKVVLPLLTVNWSVNNANVTGSKAKGEIGPANHFTTEFGAGQLYLHGKENVTTAEYNSHVVVHEFGHYLERFLYRSNTIGGQHALGQILNPRTAFGEGWGNGLSAIVLNDPVYVKVSGAAQIGGFEHNFGAKRTGDDRGIHSEGSVAYLLWHLYRNRDPDPQKGRFDRIHKVLAGPQKTTASLTSLHSFVGHYNALFGAAADGLEALFELDLDTPLDAVCAGACKGKLDVADVWDVDNDLGHAYAALRHYPQGSGALHSPGFWQLYKPLKVALNKGDGHDVLLPHTYKAPHNKQGGVRHYRYVGTGQKTTVSVEGLQTSECAVDLMNLRVFAAGSGVASDTKAKGGTAGCPTATWTALSGQVYVVEVRAPDKEPGVAVKGWDVRVEVAK